MMAQKELVLVLLLVATSFAAFVDRIPFPTNFGQPSCIVYPPSNPDTAYLVGATSFETFIPRGDIPDEFTGIQIMTVTGLTMGTLTTTLSGKIADGYAGGCLLSNDEQFIYVGTDGGVVYKIVVGEFSIAAATYLTTTPLIANTDLHFIGSIVYRDNSLYDEIYALNVFPYQLYRLDADTLDIINATDAIEISWSNSAVRMTSTIVHDRSRGVVMFPLLGIESANPTEARTRILVYPDDLGPIQSSIPLGDATADWRPAAILTPDSAYSYWALIGTVFAIDQNDLTRSFSNISFVDITSIDFVPGDSTHAWIVTSGATDTYLWNLSLPTTAQPDFNYTLEYYLDTTECGGYVWDGLFIPADPMNSYQHYAWFSWDPGNRDSYFCFLNDTTQLNQLLTLVDIEFYAHTSTMGAFWWDEDSQKLYTCGGGVQGIKTGGFFQQWRNESGRWSLEAEWPINGLCWQIIALDNDTLAFHDGRGVYAFDISTGSLYAHGEPTFQFTDSRLMWLTYDSSQKIIHAPSSESRIFFFNMSNPLVSDNLPATYFNLPPTCRNAQMSLYDPLLQALYVINYPETGFSSEIVQLTTAVFPPAFTDMVDLTAGNRALGTASWLDEDTHRVFVVEATTYGINPAQLHVVNATSAPPDYYMVHDVSLLENQPGTESWGSAVDTINRQTFVAARSSASIPVNYLWRRCWDNTSIVDISNENAGPLSFRAQHYVDGWFDASNRYSWFLVWDLESNPSIVRYSTDYEDCNPDRPVPPPPSTLQPPPITTFPSPTEPPTPPPTTRLPTIAPTGTTMGTTGTTGVPTPPPTIVDNGRKGLSGGAIAGIVIFVLVFVGIVIGLIIYFVMRSGMMRGGGGGSALSGAGSHDRQLHQRFHDEDSGKDRF